MKTGATPGSLSAPAHGTGVPPFHSAQDIHGADVDAQVAGAAELTVDIDPGYPGAAPLAT